MKSDLRIKFFASKNLRLALGAMLITVIAVICYLFVVTQTLALVSTIVLIFTLFLRRSQLHYVFRRRSHWEIVVHCDFSLQLLEFSDEGELILMQSVVIEPTSRAWPFLVFLYFRCEDSRRISLCVMSDALSQADFRRLKVVLQFAKKRPPSNILALDQQ